MATPTALRRLPWLGLAALSLLAGLLTGLVRVGWSLPVPRAEWVALHGPLMAVGFLGTVVTLERAVALGRAWAFAAPLLQAVGAALALAGAPVVLAGGLATAGAVTGSAVFVPLLSRVRPPPAHLVVLALGSLALVPGHARWALGLPVHASVPWWILFLVLTVAAERWERSLVTAPSRGAVLALGASLALLAAGAIGAVVDIRWGLRLMGPGLLATAAWMLLHDAARLSLRAGGERAHLAACVLAGHAWLGLGGWLAIALGDRIVGPAWDAVLHALFVGFLFSMIFAHAPIVLAPLLGLDVRWSPAFHLPHALLHASLLLRVVGDLAGSSAARRWGALGGVVALLLFAGVLAVRARPRS